MTNVSELIQLETDRLILRSYRTGDGPMYYRVSQNNLTHLLQFETNNAIMSIHSEKEAEAVIRDLMDCWTRRKALFMGVFLKETGEFVAQIYIGVVNWALPEFEIGYFADAAHEGKGYVSEAVTRALKFLFNDLEAHRVRLECNETNLRSIKVAERCGFVREGLIRETKRRPDGTFTGDVHYGLLRSEFIP